MPIQQARLARVNAGLAGGEAGRPELIARLRVKWAVTATTSGINLGTVGVVLMIVGAVGLLLSLVFWSSWGGFGSRSGATATVVRDEPTTLR
jgi:hypothetical protein